MTVESEPEPRTRTDAGKPGGRGGTTNPVIEEIEAGIVASARASRRASTLNFSKYNGGRAQIETATEAGTVTAAFFKTQARTRC